MDILVKLTVPNYVYTFYDNAAEFIAETSAEKLMSDALTAYAGMISRDVAEVRQKTMEDRQDT